MKMLLLDVINKKNAIGDLIIMQQLKSEIRELEHIKLLYEMQIHN